MTTNAEIPFVGAYWSARKETRRDCAVRIVKFFEAIAEQPPFARWYFKTRSRKAVLVPFEISVEAIHHQLKTNDRDIDGATIPELGFSLNVWNGSDDAPASFAVTCGAFSKYVKNSAVLSLPPRCVPIDTGTGELLLRLLQRSVEVWDPDDAAATSSERITRAGGRSPWETNEWFVYRRGKGITSSENRGSQ
jgi:hypothetical protein